MLTVTFRPIKVWPDGWRDRDRERVASPFRATYRDTKVLLEDELRHLDAVDAHVQLDVRPGDVRRDGFMRADAKVGHPGVILTVETPAHGTLVYATDRFMAGWRGTEGWHVNLRAVALGMEALRKVDRYGIADRGQQYAGYRELGAGTPMGPPKMTVEAAARFLIAHGEMGEAPATVDEILTATTDLDGVGGEVLTSYFRHASKALHPDRGGDPVLFAQLTEARRLLLKAAS